MIVLVVERCERSILISTPLSKFSKLSKFNIFSGEGGWSTYISVGRGWWLCTGLLIFYAVAESRKIRVNPAKFAKTHTKYRKIHRKSYQVHACKTYLKLKIKVNRAKFTKTHKIPQNSQEILSNTRL